MLSPVYPSSVAVGLPTRTAVMVPIHQHLSPAGDGRLKLTGSMIRMHTLYISLVCRSYFVIHYRREITPVYAGDNRASMPMYKRVHGGAIYVMIER
jgi:hypothetical protein